jgi:acyl carrier protein
METVLLGSVPELDSMSVLALVAALEDQLALTVDDEDLSSATFATMGSLVALVNEKVSNQIAL